MAETKNITNVQFLDKVGLSQLWKHVKENDIDTAVVNVTRDNDTAEQITFTRGGIGKKNKIALNLKPFPVATVTGLTEGEKVLSLSGTKLSTDFTTEYSKENNKIYLLGKAGSDPSEAGVGGRAVLGEVDTTDFVKDGLLSDVKLIIIPDNEAAAPGTDHAKAGTYLKFTFNVNDETGVHGHKDIYVNVTSLIDVYGVENEGYLTLNSDTKQFALDATAKKAVTNYVDADACASTTTDFVTVTTATSDHSLKVAAVTTDNVAEVNKGTVPSTNALATSKLVQAAYKELDDKFEGYMIEPGADKGSESLPVYYDVDSHTLNTITSLDIAKGALTAGAATLDSVTATGDVKCATLTTEGTAAVGSLKSTGAIEAVGATFTADVNASGYGVTADTFTGDLTGNAASANKVNNKLTVSITSGDPASKQQIEFDGSDALSISMTAFTAADIDEICK